MSDSRPLGKDTAVTLGLVLLVVSAAAGGAWRLSGVVHEQETQKERIRVLEQKRDTDDGVLREVRDRLAEVAAEMRLLRRDVDEQRRVAGAR